MTDYETMERCGCGQLKYDESELDRALRERSVAYRLYHQIARERRHLKDALWLSVVTGFCGWLTLLVVALT
jgi:hypothetical protein